MVFSRLARSLFLGRGNATAPIVNYIRMEGVIASSRGARGPQARRIISMERVEKWLKRAFLPGMRTFKPAAVAIAITSPGGSAAQSELIHQRIRSLAKQTGIPVFTFAEDIAASGGYWLMCAGDEVYSTATSLVGSIGVITAGFGLHRVLQKFEVERRVYTAGKYKDQLDPFKPVKPEEAQRIQELLSDLHESFQEVVRSSRGNKLDTSNEEELWSGRVWTGRQAAQLGLIDAVGTMESVCKQKFGEKTIFVQCGEPPRPGLLDALGARAPSLLVQSLGSQGGLYHAATSATQGVLDEVEYRSMMARYGL